jgi:LacI family transcriptional regulator
MKRLAPHDRVGAERARGPTIHQLAEASGVGTATVDRVLNGRGGVRNVTREKVLHALSALGARPAASMPQRRIAFLSDSGVSFNRSLQQAVDAHASSHRENGFRMTGMETAEVNSVRFAQSIEREAENADGLVLVAREDLMINRAVRAVVARGVAVVCITTDLPGSNRLAYVGNDQASAGATAGYLMGRVLGGRSGKVLLVCSAPYRCQEERELGFRRILRSEFTRLNVDEHVSSNDRSEHSYSNVKRYIEEHGPPVGIYNVAGGNVGIARALDDAGLQGKVPFIGHELNANSRMLLESGGMDFVIGHDLDREVAAAVAAIETHLDRRPLPPIAPTAVRIFTKYSCN